MLNVIGKGGIHLSCTGGECIHVCLRSLAAPLFAPLFLPFSVSLLHLMSVPPNRPPHSQRLTTLPPLRTEFALISRPHISLLQSSKPHSQRRSLRPHPRPHLPLAAHPPRLPLRAARLGSPCLSRLRTLPWCVCVCVYACACGCVRACVRVCVYA